MSEQMVIRLVGSIVVGVIAHLWLLYAPAATAADSKNVLVLYSNNRLVPANVAIDRGLRSSFASLVAQPVQIFSEFLDNPEFGGESYERTMTTYLREKYSSRPPDAILAVSDEALDYLVRGRSGLFAGVPLVYTAVARSFLQSVPELPGNAVGVPIEHDFAGSIEQALRLHPEAERLVIVTGASERDRQREARLRREVPPVAGHLPVEYLAGLPTEAVLKLLGELDPRAVVFTPGYFQDGQGRHYSPHQAALLMATVATAPMYGPFDTFIGTGVVGGRMPSFEDMGRQGANIVASLFAGHAPASLRLPEVMPTMLQVDWRQVRRWGIDESQLPGDVIVHFREPTFWEAYWHVAIIALAVILLQAALITSLLVEHRRRRTAEQAVQKQHIELAHASRLAVAGELTASIAHEINQPLGAVQTSADAADLLLQAGGDRRDDLLRIVTRIRRDNLRASDVIRRLRTLLAKHEPDRQSFDLNAAVSEVATLVRAEALERQVILDIRTDALPSCVQGDQTQVQQVLINLLLNAMDAVTGLPEDRRRVIVSVDRSSGGVCVHVQDRGRGIAPENLPRLFDSFFSTKQRGMGLGLSIARTIVEAHGGRIWVETGKSEGAGLHFCLPETVRSSIPAPELT